MEFREIGSNNLIVKFEEVGQSDEGTLVGQEVTGRNNSLMYTFRRSDGCTWRTWGAFDLDDKLGRVKPGEFVRISYLGRDSEGRKKLFRVEVAAE
jgi:hypothetical protein